MITDARIRDLIARCSGAAVEACRDDVAIHELGIDSLVLTSLVSQCEVMLGREVEDSFILQLMTAQTVGDVVALVQAQSV